MDNKDIKARGVVGVKSASVVIPVGMVSRRILQSSQQHIKRWQENRQVNQSQEYKEAQRPRIATEGRFGLAKNNHHADRAPYRSDDYNLMAALMIATMMNLRILAKHQS